MEEAVEIFLFVETKLLEKKNTFHVNWIRMLTLFSLSAFITLTKTDWILLRYDRVQLIQSNLAGYKRNKNLLEFYFINLVAHKTANSIFTCKPHSAVQREFYDKSQIILSHESFKWQLLNSIDCSVPNYIQTNGTLNLFDFFFQQRNSKKYVTFKVSIYIPTRFCFFFSFTV